MGRKGLYSIIKKQTANFQKKTAVNSKKMADYLMAFL